MKTIAIEKHLITPMYRQKSRRESVRGVDRGNAASASFDLDQTADCGSARFWRGRVEEFHERPRLPLAHRARQFLAAARHPGKAAGRFPRSGAAELRSHGGHRKLPAAFPRSAPSSARGRGVRAAREARTGNGDPAPASATGAPRDRRGGRRFAENPERGDFGRGDRTRRRGSDRSDVPRLLPPPHCLGGKGGPAAGREAPYPRRLAGRGGVRARWTRSAVRRRQRSRVPEASPPDRARSAKRPNLTKRELALRLGGCGSTPQEIVSPTMR